MIQLREILFSTLILAVSSHAFGSWSKIGDDRLTTRFGWQTPSLNTQIIAPPTLSDTKVEYQPNVASKFIIGLSYRNIGFTVGSKGPAEEESIQQKGVTKSKDYQLRFTGSHTIEAYYQKYEGLFVENSAALDNTYENSLYRIQRPDLVTEKYGGAYYYNFHEKDFSLKVAFDQGGIPKGSGWSYFLFGSTNRYSIEGESSLIPSSVSDEFGSMASIKGVALQTLAGGMGIGGIATLGGLYATGFISVGFGYQKQTSKLTDDTLEETSKTGAASSGRIGLGYNAGNHVVATQLIIDSVSSIIREGEINSQTVEATITYGYRWDGVNIPFLNPLSKLFD